MEIGENIDRVIKNQHLSQAYVAKKLGIGRQQLNDIIHLRRPLPIKLVVPLCKAIRCDPNCIFNWQAGTLANDGRHSPERETLTSCRK